MMYNMIRFGLFLASPLLLTGCGTGAGEAVAVGSAAISTANALGAAAQQAAANSKAAAPAVKPTNTGKVIYVGPNGTTVQENGKTYFIPKPEWQR